jgi:hypothetical protein
MWPKHVASDFDGFAASVFVEPLSDKPAASSAGLPADVQDGAEASACVITDGEFAAQQILLTRCDPQSVGMIGSSGVIPQTLSGMSPQSTFCLRRCLQAQPSC